MKKLSASIPDLLSTDDPDFVKRNLLQVEVFYQDFNYENIAEVPAYTVTTIIQILPTII